MTRKKEKPIIFISDLHADRWDREKRESFFEVIDFVEESAAELYILGDIFDFPALKGESIWPKHSDLILKLRALPDRGVPLVYLIGNHDISLRGIELDEDGFVMTYCDRKRPLERVLRGKKVYMEHGHYYDPLFRDHIYDAIDFLREVSGQPVDRKAVDFLRDIVRIFQRKPKSTVADKGIDAEQKNEVGVPSKFLKIWEQAAEQILKRTRCDIVLFGHTHAPAITSMEGLQQWYVNTGDWVDHSTYVELTSGGIVLKDRIAGETLQEAVFAGSA